MASERVSARASAHRRPGRGVKRAGLGLAPAHFESRHQESRAVLKKVTEPAMPGGSSSDGGDSESAASECSTLSEAAAAARLSTLAALPALDRFGFRVASTAARGYVVRGEGAPRSADAARREHGELLKWASMLGPRWPSWTRGPRALLLRRRVRRGIPPAVRAAAWDALVAVDVLHPTLPDYRELVERCPADVSEEIERDLHRTFPENALFGAAAGASGAAGGGGGGGGGGAPVGSAPDGIALLGNLLRALAGLDGELGYCQGLNYVGGLLLLFMPEERALCLLVGLLRVCRLRNLFLPGLPGLQAALHALRALLASALPQLAAHLEREGVEPSTYATRWFMTLFVGCLPFEGCLRALDVLCLERDGKVLFRLALAVLQAREAALLELRGERLLDALRAAPAECGEMDALFARAFALRLRRRELVGAGALLGG
jgi:hypothetical protein